MKQSVQTLQQFAIESAYKVGDIHLKYFRKDNQNAEIKSNISDLVTRADKESEAYLIEQITYNFPDHNILGEESGNHEGKHKSGYRWVIDPLDGTNNYNQGLPVFAVSIGLQYENTTIMGVVYAPYLKELFTVIKGEGSFLNGERLKVSEKTELNECVLGTGFPYDKGTNPINNISNVAAILPHLRGIRRMGAAAYDLCSTAAGYLDAYWELDLKPWDMCAGALIVEEAGGEIFHFRNDRNISIIAGNHNLIEKVRTFIK
ncbi:MAG: inositol monophosphatase [Culturomica sp.]|jgi:myo-inositol-1(or 4)-monophosphatase|nr:inositol monophosphatase [Culturomica sp.]